MDVGAHVDVDVIASPSSADEVVRNSAAAEAALAQRSWEYGRAKSKAGRAGAEPCLEASRVGRSYAGLCTAMADLVGAFAVD